MSRRGEHAVVLGASMAGLMAARVLTEFYDRVSVVERDGLDDSAEPRRGVPQSRQPHALLARCGQILDELFPGITDEMIAEGVHRWSDGDLSRFYGIFAGHQIIREGHLPDPGSVVNLYTSRALLECHVRRRVRSLPTVTLLDGRDLDALTFGSGGSGAVNGVRVTHRAAQQTSDVRADLVVDATGRGSRTPTFLAEAGFPVPSEDRLPVDVCYASMPVRIADGLLREYALFDLFAPGKPRGYAMFRCEHDSWILGIGTLGRDIKPPVSAAQLLQCAREMMPAHASAALASAEPLADVALHRFPASRWRRYDKLRRSPGRLLVVGDAVCSFNPIYGQGMTVAAIEAMTLRACLAHGGDNLVRRFHRAAAKPVRIAWQTAVGSDLALPEVAGRRTVSMRATNAYVDRVLRASETDPWITQEFLQVTGMLQPPGRLLRPAVLRRVLRPVPRRQAASRVDLTATA
ncbi:MAG: FAD-dependent monooxygenase [Mycobacterium sp.]